MVKVSFVLGLVVLGVILPNAAFAYVGPGAGLGLVGSLLAVVFAACIALFGLVMFPVMMIRRHRRKKSAQAAETTGELDR